MSKRPHLQTQFLIFVLFGDLIAPRGGQVWTASLLQMLKVLGVGSGAARSTLSRMTRNGWLKTEREGRHSLHALTARGRLILEEGGQRIFESRKTDWNGQWYQVVYSLPENKRKLRNDLRKRLTWLGFGRLAPGTWISPHNRLHEVDAMLDDLGARQYVEFFSGLRLVNGNDREIVERCWDVKNLNYQYSKFIDKWEPEYEKCTRALVKGDGLSPSECFAQRFWITHEYSPFPRLDPNLPSVLLPDGWLGDKASAMFNGYRNLLNDRNNEFINATMRKPNGRKS
jgi:phenylacetic acid degradation operon negative regulatory protein